MAFSDFFLLGVICGLAIYNDNIVDLHFPLALYKKLLNVEPNLDDLTEMMPSVGRSMKQLIEAQERDFTKRSLIVECCSSLEIALVHVVWIVY